MLKDKIDIELLKKWEISNTWNSAANSAEGTISSMMDGPSYHKKRIKNKTNHSDLALANIFTHMRVNPSKPGRSEQICNCHVFPVGLKDTPKKVGNIINSSELDLDKFVKETIRMAKKNQEQNEVRNQKYENGGTSQNTIFCLGEKGVGKTHLQNYILSRYSEKYDAEKVIFVRLNLLRSFGGFDTSFTRWMAAQATKIVCRYYCKDSNFFNKREELSINYRTQVIKQIEKNYSKPDERIARKKALNIMLKELNEDVRGADISPEWLDEEFADIIWQCAVNQGFTFLVVFDGLDQLTGTFVSEEKKELRIKQLVSYLGMESVPYNVCNLIFLRYDTHRELLEMLQEAGAYPYVESMDYEVSHVVPCSSKQIYQKRMTYVLDLLGEEAISYSKAIRFDDFYKNTRSGLNTLEDGKELCYADAVEYLASDNPRSAVQLMRTSVIHFIEANNLNDYNKLYHFTESAMFGEMIYPPMGYSYQKQGGTLVRKLNQHNYGSFDILFLPSVFSFPYDRNSKSAEVFSDVPFEYLLGIRLLQALQMFEKSYPGKPCVGSELVAFLKFVFGYSPEISLRLLEEYSDYEIINANIRESEIPSTNILDKRLSITIKGAKILDQYIFDLTYLAISGLTFSAPDELVNSDISTSAIFMLKSPKIHGSSDWVVAKIINAFSIMKLIIWINDSQKSNSTMLIKRTDQHFPNTLISWSEVYDEFKRGESELYSLSEKIISVIYALAEKSISGLEEAAQKEVVCTVNKFLTHQVNSRTA